MTPHESAPLTRGIGLWQATAINITQIVGAGVFATIPLILGILPGAYALLAWLVAGVLILCDSLIWGELGAALPSSGGSYHILLESYGRSRWGRMMAFLFVWQILISGPLEVGSGLVAAAQFSTYVDRDFGEYDKRNTESRSITIADDQKLTISIGPSRLLGFGLGVVILLLLYRRVTTLGRMSVVFLVGVLAVLGWVLIEGALRFDPARAFDTYVTAEDWHSSFGLSLGAGMALAIFSYLGYYNVCYLGSEVRSPARTIPRAIIFSSLTVVVIFTLVHLAITGVVPWQEAKAETDNLTAEFMNRIHGPWAASVVSLLLIGSCFASCFAGTLGYSRVPFAAAQEGHFFRWFAAVHPRLHIPHRSLLLIGAMVLFWSFFGLGDIINALIATRILEQFVAQILAVILLRNLQPDRPRPWRMWLYPLPCIVALVGWVYVYLSTGRLFIAIGAGTLLIGFVVFLIWSKRQKAWPFVASGQ
jgi:basic amino acid/polyamine antiporter, APA family